MSTGTICDYCHAIINERNHWEVQKMDAEMPKWDTTWHFCHSSHAAKWAKKYAKEHRPEMG